MFQRFIAWVIRGAVGALTKRDLAALKTEIASQLATQFENFTNKAVADLETRLDAAMTKRFGAFQGKILGDVIKEKITAEVGELRNDIADKLDASPLVELVERVEMAVAANQPEEPKKPARRTRRK